MGVSLSFASRYHLITVFLFGIVVDVVVDIERQCNIPVEEKSFPSPQPLFESGGQSDYSDQTVLSLTLDTHNKTRISANAKMTTHGSYDRRVKKQYFQFHHDMDL